MGNHTSFVGNLEKKITETGIQSGNQLTLQWIHWQSRKVQHSDSKYEKRGSASHIRRSDILQVFQGVHHGASLPQEGVILAASDHHQGAMRRVARMLRPA